MSSRGQEIAMDKPRNALGEITISQKEWRDMGAALALSGREFEIVRGLLSGKKESTIALDLEISIHTVHTHIKRLYRKLGINDRSALLIRLFASVLSTRNTGPRNA